MRVYIAGPYTKGDVVLNVREAIRVAEQLSARGHIPFVPHLTHFWHLVFPHKPDFWYDYDNQWLDLCEAVIRIPGESIGADAEVARAIENNIPVYFTLNQFLKAHGIGDWRPK